MKLLHNIGTLRHPSYNTPDEVAACVDAMSFDGVYVNVWEHRELLRGRSAVLFVMGQWAGLDNSFDVEAPRLEALCEWPQLYELRDAYGCELGWHSFSHRDLTTLHGEELAREVKPPFPMRLFAYPHGRFNVETIEAVKAAGYEDAYSVDQGNGERWQRRREYL